MMVVEEQIRAWRRAQQASAAALVEECTEALLTTIGRSDAPNAPTGPDLERAAAGLRARAAAALTGDEVLSALPKPPANETREALRLSWLGLLPELVITPPEPRLELAVPRLALAAAIGSLLGMMLLGGILHWFLGMRPLGMLIGGMLGAAGVVYGVAVLARNPKLRTGLKAALGVSTAAQLFLSFSTIGMGGLWGRLAGAGGLLRRLLLFATVAALLYFTRQSNRHDPGAFKPVVEGLLRQWVDYGQLLLLSLTSAADEAEPVRQLDTELARSIVALHRVSAADLPLAAEAVLQDARRAGVEGIDGEARFVGKVTGEKQRLLWSDELAGQFRPFGAIEPGDEVLVEEEPVIQHGQVIAHGRVRKVRRA